MGNASSSFSIHESEYPCQYSIHSCHTRFATLHYVPASPGVYWGFLFSSGGEVYKKTRQRAQDCFTSLARNNIYYGLCASSNKYHGNTTRATFPFSKSSWPLTCL